MVNAKRNRNEFQMKHNRHHRSMIWLIVIYFQLRNYPWNQISYQKFILTRLFPHCVRVVFTFGIMQSQKSEEKKKEKIKNISTNQRSDNGIISCVSAYNIFIIVSLSLCLSFERELLTYNHVPDVVVLYRTSFTRCEL